ncbi:hypothetical protein NXC14_PA00477 (plasmid) [Rhizobium sp. NXC14]|nr:hypothetical protein NXC14_PA00477 [Rhizobium sp. NXC14]
MGGNARECSGLWVSATSRCRSGWQMHGNPTPCKEHGPKTGAIVSTRESTVASVSNTVFADLAGRKLRSRLLPEGHVAPVTDKEEPHLAEMPRVKWKALNGICQRIESLGAPWPGGSS